jgi:uncharacterized protein (TIGR02118 family)
VLRISAVYLNSPGRRFDGAYYIEKHTPFTQELLSPYGLNRRCTTLGKTGKNNFLPPFWAISELVLTSRAAVDAAIAQRGQALFADISNDTEVAPVLQISSLCGDVTEAKGL